MALWNSKIEYGTASKALHWIIFLVLVGMSIVGLIFADMERGPDKTSLMQLHASTGLLALMLMVLRVLVRFKGEAPAPLDPAAVMLNRVAALTHGLLYLLIFALIGAGIMTLFTAQVPVPFYGLFQIASPLANDHAAHEVWEEVHETIWWVLTGFVVLHIAGALYHQIVKKDDTIARMTHGVKNPPWEE
ncbi:cytochrome b [Kordiimonas marina]|uniref:cytochrome b n=1 Tax=Kordiimonas marina TaxID=2872312 RepID=UPI001FF1F608|nr:cytochrome b [Kordiimonas marina]MCJ9430707.1 cytochrome b [Kordiimonas marina]